MQSTALAYISQFRVNPSVNLSAIKLFFTTFTYLRAEIFVSSFFYSIYRIKAWHQLLKTKRNQKISKYSLWLYSTFLLKPNAASIFLLCMQKVSITLQKKNYLLPLQFNYLQNDMKRTNESLNEIAEKDVNNPNNPLFNFEYSIYIN